MTFAFRLSESRQASIGVEQTKIVQISDFFEMPEAVISAAADQRFAQINPHYPGVRAAVDMLLLNALCDGVSKLAARHLDAPERAWEGQAWFSIVTQKPERLTPIQRLPHFDGFDESQLAVMIYLDQTEHGGTGFYRHLETGFERITEARYPDYKSRLEQGVRESGLPPAAYPTDGAPHFAKFHESDATFNSFILYPGTLLHSGVIRNDLPLSPAPRVGRLTINGFFRPK